MILYEGGICRRRPGFGHCPSWKFHTWWADHDGKWKCVGVTILGHAFFWSKRV